MKHFRSNYVIGINKEKYQPCTNKKEALELYDSLVKLSKTKGSGYFHQPIDLFKDGEVIYDFYYFGAPKNK